MKRRAGITILEMLVVVAIISLMAGLMYPSFTSGLDGIKLNSSADEVAAFLNGAVERAQRKNVPIEVTVLKAENAIVLRSTEPNFLRRLDIAQGVAIEKILPEGADNSLAPRVFVIYPGGTVPRVGVQLAASQGRKRIIRIDPITGSPVIERLSSAAY
jgi:prepilin-type N-terminal cleavage/methylation domain-containing protein